MGASSGSGAARLRIIVLSLLGALAVLCFLASFLADGVYAGVLMRTASGFGIACAIIGITFAFGNGEDRDRGARRSGRSRSR